MWLFWFACQSDEGVKAYNANPEITITSHSEDAELEEGVSVSLRAAVSDPNHSEEELLVSWYADTELVCDWAPPDMAGTSFCDFEPRIDSTRIVAEVRDPDGAGGQDEISLIISATSAPSISISSPIGSEIYYSDLIIEFNALVSDIEDPPELLSVMWTSSLDGDLPLPEFSDSGGMLSGSLTLSEGQHFIQATVTDTTGKQSQTDVNLTVNPPNSPPNCSIVSPNSQEVGVVGENMNFVGLVTDNEDILSELSASWTSSIDGVLGSVSPTSSGDILFSTSLLSVGSHSIRLEVFDSQSSCADEIFLTVGEPPLVQIDVPLDGSTYNEGEIITFVGLLSDDSTQENQLVLSWTSNIDGEFSNNPAASSGMAQTTISDLSVGSHLISLSAMDMDGLIGDAVIVININGLPSQPSLSISPNPATTSNTLEATAYGSIDPENQSVSYSYIWFVDGVLSSHTGSTLPSSATSKGELWLVESTPSDGHGSGPVGSDSLEIMNTNPEVSGVVISPSFPLITDVLGCSGTVVDPDETPLQQIEWVNLNTGLSLGTNTTLIVDPTLVGVGDDIECIITAIDSDSAQASGTATVTLLNSDPVVTSLVISPSSPTPSDTVTCSGSSSDPNGDTPTLSYSWAVNGLAAGVGPTLALSNTQRNDVITCTLTATDSDGGTVTASIVEIVANSIPVIDSVAITPDPPSAQSVLICTVVANDSDGDPLTTTTDWSINGNYILSSNYLSGPFSLNDIIRCTATVNDGQDNSLPLFAQVSIDNGPPVISSLTITPDPATTVDDLSVLVSVSDPEGDAITLSYVWMVNGVDQLNNTTFLSSSTFQKSDTVSLMVTPSDSLSSGTQQSAVLVVSNAPPEAPMISIVPSVAQETENLICEVDVDSFDADNDQITYTFSWVINNILYNGSVSSTNYVGDTIPFSETLEGDNWECTVTPNDGTDNGPTSSATSSVITLGCSADAEWALEVTSGMWACVNDANITTYPDNFNMCAQGFTPVTYDLVQSLGLGYPTLQESADFWNWYGSLASSGDKTYIRTGQKRRGGCSLNDHGDLYIAQFHSYSQAGEGWYDLYYGGGSCTLSTSSANNMSHALAGVLCVYGTYVDPHN